MSRDKEPVLEQNTYFQYLGTIELRVQRDKEAIFIMGEKEGKKMGEGRAKWC